MFKFNDARDWFFNKRLGLFVHWGLYSINGFHEQEMFRRNIPRHIYAKLKDQFNPIEFNPDLWIDMAQEAGMEYIVFTSKHQDGFCMWDTKYTDFNIMNTPYKKDILAMLAEACHRRNFPLFIYYCWTDNMHTNFPNRGEWHQWLVPQEGDIPDTVKYIEYVKNQVVELCTNYGEIAGFWWDCGQEMKCIDHSVNDMIRELQPKALINGRGLDEGDYSTPERNYNESVYQVRKFTYPTEACESIGMNSWGYRFEEDYFSSKHLIQSIDRTLCLGGNYLLNVGPKSDGTIGREFTECLNKIGKWYNMAKEAFRDADSVSNAIANENVYATRKGNNIYLHLYRDPQGSSVEIKPLDEIPQNVTLLNDGRQLDVKRDQCTKYWRDPMGYLRIRELPVEEFYDTVMIVKLEYKKLPKVFIEACSSDMMLKAEVHKQVRD